MLLAEDAIVESEGEETRGKARGSTEDEGEEEEERWLWLAS